MDDIERIKKILAILERTINELSQVAQDMAADNKNKETAYKVKISDKGKLGH